MKMEKKGGMDRHCMMCGAQWGTCMCGKIMVVYGLVVGVLGVLLWGG